MTVQDETDMHEDEDGAKLGPRRKLLIVDDEPNVRKAIARVFMDDFEIFESGNGDDALTLALKIAPDVVISDQRIPGRQGVDVLREIRTKLPKTVRILITGFIDYSSVVDAVNAAHIHHYFEKPFHTVDLRTVVEALVKNTELEKRHNDLLSQLEHSVHRLQRSNRELLSNEADLSRIVAERTRELTQANRELLAANERLRALAVRDGLTELFNHRSLVEHLDLEIARSGRYGRPFSLIFMDIDDFKQVNDVAGHAAGDAVLCTLASLLRPEREGMRRSDFVARYGGEEFCIILPETPIEGGIIKAQRLRECVASADWQQAVENLPRSITVSIGVAAFPEHGDNRETLLINADRALYEAKKAGKNCVARAAAAVNKNA